MSQSSISVQFVARYNIMFFQPQRLEGVQEPPCFLEFAASFDTSSTVSSFSSDSPSYPTSQPLSTSTSSSSSLPNVTMDMISNGDLDSLLTLQPHLQLDDYTMGIPLFPTPTPPIMSSMSPMQDSTSGSPPTTVSPPGSSNTLQSHLSTPSLAPLNSTYRITKPKRSKPGPKPKKPKQPSLSPPQSFLHSGNLPTIVDNGIMQAVDDEEDESPEVLDKRYRNNLAAKKYRQKKVDRISELEMALSEMTRERDELRLLLARKEAEGQVLREVMRKEGR
ncbi:hypothetical protein AA313_de0209855 [Arthrobotrys entomopaga]|nr:hypothetical protein AA313_de0209855 [Arthrobotrys entomopaga]